MGNRRRSSRLLPAALSHTGPGGEARMVEVGHKPVTRREATARGRVTMSRQAVALVKAGKGPKGNVIEVARLAGIMAAKRTSDLIPLCHPLPLTGIDVQIAPRSDGFDIEAVTRTTAQTGVEMEALTAVSVAALTLYDMAKAVDKAMTIGGIELVAKSGGRSGTWVRDEQARPKTQTGQRAR